MAFQAVSNTLLTPENAHYPATCLQYHGIETTDRDLPHPVVLYVWVYVTNAVSLKNVTGLVLLVNTRCPPIPGLYEVWKSSNTTPKLGATEFALQFQTPLRSTHV
jgi:hypothetical protein